MSNNFLESIKKDLARPSPPRGKEIVDSRNLHLLIDAYERMESAMRAEYLSKSLRYPVGVEQYIDEALRVAFLHTGRDITGLMCAISHSIIAILKERTDQERIRKGKFDASDY
jgi:hypothetical protein